MGNMNLGSISAEVLNLVENIPTSISGGTLNNIAERAVSYVEQYTGATIGSTSIALKYQGPIINFTAAETLEYMNLIGADVSSYSVGPVSVSRGGESNLIKSAEKFREMGERQLVELGHNIPFTKVFGA